MSLTKQPTTFCQLKRGWQVVEAFIDNGVSGSKESRPALDRLFAAAKRRKFSAVLVYRYDRFARSLRQLVNALCEFEALEPQQATLARSPVGLPFFSHPRRRSLGVSTIFSTLPIYH